MGDQGGFDGAAGDFIPQDEVLIGDAVVGIDGDGGLSVAGEFCRDDMRGAFEVLDGGACVDFDG